MPIKTICVLIYQYQSKNGAHECTKHHLQDDSFKNITFFLNKISRVKKRKDDNLKHNNKRPFALK